MIIRPLAPAPIYPYQQDGVNYLISRERAGLHDVPGLGKTAQFIRAADAIHAQRGIVIAPAKVRRNTVKQFGLWATHGYKITEGRSVHDFIAWQRGRYHILVTSYEQATKWATSIYRSGEPIDFVALDEAHYLKNSDAARTQAILGRTYDGTGGLVSWAEHVWHVTGTAMANDPLDIFTFLKLCRATTLSQPAFVKKYFFSDQTRWGSRQTVRPQMQAELTALVNGNRIRRTLADVGFQLPAIRLDPLVVDGDTTQIVNLLKTYPNLSQAIIEAVKQGGISFLDAQHMMTLRRLLGEAKAPAYAHILLNDLIATNMEKHVVMGSHIDALNFVHEFLTKHHIKSVLVNGTVSDSKAHKYVEQFQNDPDTTVFLGNIKSAGMGVDLYSASRLDMLESDWTPMGNSQAIKRIHRIGQTKPCFIRFVSLARTFDEHVNELVISKTAAIAEIDGDAMLAHA